VKKLDYSYLEGMEDTIKEMQRDGVVFVRPTHGKLFRVFGAPDNEEVRQVLTTLCTRYHKDVWYFRMPDHETRQQICATLFMMDVEQIVLEPDEQLQQKMILN